MANGSTVTGIGRKIAHYFYSDGHEILIYVHRRKVMIRTKRPASTARYPRTKKSASFTAMRWPTRGGVATVDGAGRPARGLLS